MSSALAAYAVSTIVLVVLAVAGLAKLTSPTPSADTLASIDIPVPNAAVRLLGLGEVTLAGVAAVTASPMFLAATALLHLGFTAVVVAVRRTQQRNVLAGSGDGPVSCGCFGSSGAAPGRLHIAVTLVSALVLGLTSFLASRDAVASSDLFSDGLATSLLTVALVATGAALVVLLLTSLAELFDSFEPKPTAAPLALRHR